MQHADSPAAPEAAPEAIDAIFHALGDASRRAILERISHRPVSISQVAAPMEMSLAAVVQHIQVLEKSGLIRTEKVGRTRTCSLEPRGFSLAEQWITRRRALWERRFDRLGDLLDGEED